MKKGFERKSNRLDLTEYNKYQSYFLTLTCANERKAFIKKTRVDDYITVLKEQAIENEMSIFAYCFMPDHLHILVEGESLIDFVRKFKQITGYRYKQNTGKKLWQKSFYDHILRDEENIKDVSFYIFTNPVRAGLVEKFTDYPYTGSLEFDWKETFNLET